MRASVSLVGLAVLSSMAWGCGENVTPSVDAPSGADAGRDASAMDAPSVEGGPLDAPAADAAEIDGGGGDATLVDGGELDGGPDDAGAGTDAGAPPEPRIVSTGTAGTILRGTVITPTGPIEGEVLVMGSTIACVAPSCAGSPGASTATVVETEGVILPGLIDVDDHTLWRAFDASDWTPSRLYANHNQWVSEARYGEVVDAWQSLSATGSVPCELEKYGSIAALLAGTTSVVSSIATNRVCYDSLARNLEHSDGLGPNRVQFAVSLPSTSGADSVCSNFAAGDTNAYFVHVGEGVDGLAMNELMALRTAPTMDGCLSVPQTTVVHGTAFDAAALGTIDTAGMGLAWVPESDVTLYGATLDASIAVDLGIRVSLATGFVTGSPDLLHALRGADAIDDARFGDALDAEDLVAMVTEMPASQAGLGGSIGHIEVGMVADLLVVAGDRSMPYDAVVTAEPGDVRLVMVGGVPLYGDSVLSPLGAATCEAFDACGTPKFLCVVAPSTTATDRLDQTLGEITTALSAALTAYDATSGDAPFAPLAPLLVCP